MKEIRPGSRPPLLIAHAAGNHPERAATAFADGADFVELDLWCHRGRLEARHERRLPFSVPLLYERWYLKRPRGLEGGSFATTSGSEKAGLFLDLKNGGAEMASLVAGLAAELPGVPIAVSSQYWYILRELAARSPGLPLFYSVDVEAKLDLFLSIAARDSRPAGVSCRHTLLNVGRIDELHRRGCAVVAWTVDEPERAATLAGWGTDAITTHEVRRIRQQVVDA